MPRGSGAFSQTKLPRNSAGRGTSQTFGIERLGWLLGRIAQETLEPRARITLGYDGVPAVVAFPLQEEPGEVGNLGLFGLGQGFTDTDQFEGRRAHDSTLAGRVAPVNRCATLAGRVEP